MSYVLKVRGDFSRPIVAEYTCPEHGTFSCYVNREPNGDAPDEVACPEKIEAIVGGTHEAVTIECELRSTWTPSRVLGRVKRWEAVRGKWEKPERKTYLDTRELGEGQDIEEFKAKRRAIWDEKRRAEIKEMI